MYLDSFEKILMLRYVRLFRLEFDQSSKDSD